MQARTNTKCFRVRKLDFIQSIESAMPQEQRMRFYRRRKCS